MLAFGSHCDRPWYRRRQGFALLELLLAMTVAASVASVLVVSLRIAFKAREAGTEEVGTLRTADTALRRIDADLRGVLPPTGVLAGGFVGEDGQDEQGRFADTLSYTTNNPMHPAGRRMGELIRVRLSLVDRSEIGQFASFAEDPDDDTEEFAVQGRCLVRTVTTNLLPTAEAAQSQQVLAERVVGFNVEYSDGSDWTDSWNSSQQGDTLPTAIRVTLSLLIDDEVDPNVVEPARFTMQRVSVLPIAPSRSARQTEAAGG